MLYTPTQSPSPLIKTINFNLRFINKATTTKEADSPIIYSIYQIIPAVNNTKQLNPTAISNEQPALSSKKRTQRKNTSGEATALFTVHPTLNRSWILTNL